jgi:AcrR family transcriptional regulator
VSETKRSTRPARRDAQPRPAADIDPRVLRATVSVLAEGGWDELSLERVADAAGVSRVTLWRQGITREMLTRALLVELGNDYRDSMWHVLTASGTARERLERALSTLCEVAERHLDLLLASDTSFHRAWAESKPRVSFLEPFIRISEDGIADGTLRALAPASATADLLFNTVCWSYVHLRGRHGWQPKLTRQRVVALALDGIAAR